MVETLDRRTAPLLPKEIDIPSLVEEQLLEADVIISTGTLAGIDLPAGIDIVADTGSVGIGRISLAAGSLDMKISWARLEITGDISTPLDVTYEKGYEDLDDIRPDPLNQLRSFVQDIGAPGLLSTDLIREAEAVVQRYNASARETDEEWAERLAEDASDLSD